MNISLFISRFLYRIRYQLIFGSILVTALVAYFTKFLPKEYTVNTSIYTGIVSSTTLNDDGGSVDYQTVNNTFDNLINLLRSQKTLENVSLNLLAINLIHGNPEKDNEYILAENYKKLIEMVPEQVKSLINKKSVERTVENFRNYAKHTPHNFIYELQNGWKPYYSFEALNTINIQRAGSSDMINLSYTSSDPGITTSTVKLFNEALLNSYNELRYSSTNDVIAYFEGEVRKWRTRLNKQEDELTRYNIEHNVINYLEQTKALAISYTDYEDRYEETMRRLQSSQKLVESLEKQMAIRTKLIYANKDFLKSLDNIANINGKITEMEIFTDDQVQGKNQDLKTYRNELKDAENQIASISKSMNQYHYSKEGVAIEEMVSRWLNSVIEEKKAQAELKVLDKRREDYHQTYSSFSPIGTGIKRREREIGVSESSYLQMQHALNMAYLRKKNIQLTTSELNTITDPSFPLGANKSKRVLFIIIAFIGSLVFIIGWYLFVELLDHTIRDGERATRLTGLPVFGAFSGRRQLRYRGYSKIWNRLSALSACNKLNQYLKKGEPAHINIFSIEKGEGKSYIATYLQKAWQKQGIRVEFIQAEKDFSVNSPEYLYANTFDDLCPEGIKGEYDVLVVEYPSIRNCSIPVTLMQKANINLMVANVCRVWKQSDNGITKYLQDIAKETPIEIYLNNANRQEVEDFTGELPPYTSQHSLASQMVHMGLTAQGTQVR